MSVDELVNTLLYEGYALYPYTPGATKNATPTPFGIVYPTAYAARSGATFDRLQLECLVRAEEEPELEVDVRFLQATGDGHRGIERRVGLGDFEHKPLCGHVSVSTAPVDDGLWRVTLVVENRTPFDGETRAEALGRSLLSTHPLVRVRRGRFVSPLEADGCENVNTWPVLASPADDSILGAAIILPDHPRIAPESRGDLFDATEIEEALLLHVHALSDAEREEIAGQDDTVRAMIDRASAAGQEDLMRLHGLLRPVEEEDVVGDPRRGEADAVIGGVTVRPGSMLVLRLGGRTDPYDRMLDGRTATLERIYVDVDGRTYLGVTVTSDPMQEIMRESGRYLFFFADEVEVAPAYPHETGGHVMSERDESGEGGFEPGPAEEGAGEKGLGTETGGSGTPDDVREQMPEARGEVRYADAEEPDEQRPTAVPKEGEVDTDPDTTKEASRGAD